jgi:hypothetical protein
MAEKYAYGIKSVKFGIPTGSNTMPGTLTPWAQTVKGSLTLSEDEAQQKEFFVEETTTAVHKVVTEAGSLKLKWRGYEITPEAIAVVKGGTAGTTGSGATKKLTYDGPVTVDIINLALQVVTTNDIVFNIYKTAVLGRFDSSLGRENLLELEVAASALDPGNGASPYQIEVPDPQA